MTCSFIVDGATASLPDNAAPTLLEALRDHLDRVAPKAGCGIGRCGACVVLLDGEPVNACLVPLVRVHGRRVTTADGLDGPTADAVRQALGENHAFQCGACAPGFLVSITYLAGLSPRPSAPEVELALSGHLCRCTGYGGIRRAIRALFR
ncbi:MAG: 2Fe-2S iron-sulfur cluster-binding protein [Phreatobacter sp.]|uniref:(2Fe-2S)-binding protein n=1 Tax=Phreatobacter sp. TaxID=1966341 RepID=UPI002732E37F|nr:2Fe-2S iron-sulfur cluster-binding protein [Phreatobacter sp.]MDP2800294.1 2Fe-2S iron-sulfur cluster-binding protein [Phreatobacter sp.]